MTCAIHYSLLYVQWDRHGVDYVRFAKNELCLKLNRNKMELCRKNPSKAKIFVWHRYCWYVANARQTFIFIFFISTERFCRDWSSQSSIHSKHLLHGINILLIIICLSTVENWHRRANLWHPKLVGKSMSSSPEVIVCTKIIFVDN